MRPVPVAALLGLIAAWPVAGRAADAPDREPVELVGRATAFAAKRAYLSYYWADDFTLLLDDEKGGKKWRVISREPTPAYDWRMGPTYPGLKVDWAAGPRVRVLGLKGVDRQPPKFHDLKLDERDVVTALVLSVETKKDEWKEFYVNNWFHRWGDKADAAVHRHYADRPAPYDVYGFVRGQAAPFDDKSRAIIDTHKDNPSLMFHGRVRTAKGRRFGFEIELIDLIGRDAATGGPKVLHGDARAIPLLDKRK